MEMVVARRRSREWQVQNVEGWIVWCGTDGINERIRCT